MSIPPRLSPEAEVSPRLGMRLAIRRSGYLLRHHGLRRFMTGAVAYLSAGMRRVHSRERFYLYEIGLDEDTALNFAAPRPDCELRLVENHEQADQLASRGYDDFRLLVPGARFNLSLGAIAVCVYVGRAFASIDWIAMSTDNLYGSAKMALKDVLSTDHACTTDALTIPQFRNSGFGSYRLAGALRYLRNRGYTECYSIIGVNNAPSRRCVERFGGRVLRVGEYRRTLGRRGCAHQPVDQPVSPVTPRQP